MVVVEGVESDVSGLAQTVKDLFAGAAGGIAQVLLGVLKLLLFKFNWTNFKLTLS